MHVDFTDAVFIANAARAEHDDELAFPRMRGLDIDAEDAWTRGRLDTKNLGLSRAASQVHFHMTFGQGLERVHPRQVDGES
jgi:ferric-dicitrate binding protein FerR (iron transport regulator)